MLMTLRPYHFTEELYRSRIASRATWPSPAWRRSRSSLEIIPQEQLNNMLRTGASDMPQIALPYAGAIGVLHNLVAWKIIYVSVRSSPLLGNCSQQRLGPGVGHNNVHS